VETLCSDQPLRTITARDASRSALWAGSLRFGHST